MEGLEEIGEMVTEMVVKMEEILAEEEIVQEIKSNITMRRRRRRRRMVEISSGDLGGGDCGGEYSGFLGGGGGRYHGEDCGGGGGVRWQSGRKLTMAVAEKKESKTRSRLIVVFFSPAYSFFGQLWGYLTRSP